MTTSLLRWRDLSVGDVSGADHRGLSCGSIVCSILSIATGMGDSRGQGGGKVADCELRIVRELCGGGMGRWWRSDRRISCPGRSDLLGRGY